MISHDALVRIILQYSKSYWRDKITITNADLPNDIHPRPYKIKEHIPDLFIRLSSGKIIVGEAKTPKDFELIRSEKQIVEFLKYIHEHAGIFLFAVPWYYHRTANSRLTYLMNSHCFSIECHFINEISTMVSHCKK